MWSLSYEPPAGDTSIDVALLATFSIADLVEANAIAPLDEWAAKYQPADFSDGYLYRTGNYYQGKLYGYQTDGDAYLLFYKKRLLKDESERRAYERLTGKSIVWGGTQKYLMRQPAMRDNLVHNALPGTLIEQQQSQMAYFNWGWNYTLSAQSSRQELRYLLVLFCASPVGSIDSINAPISLRQVLHSADECLGLQNNLLQYRYFASKKWIASATHFS